VCAEIRPSILDDSIATGGARCASGSSSGTTAYIASARRAGIGGTIGAGECARNCGHDLVSRSC
jgi:hypothetical protein